MCYFPLTGKTPDEIRKTFNIKNDFTPEEEEQVGSQCFYIYIVSIFCHCSYQIRKENEWCEEK